MVGQLGDGTSAEDAPAFTTYELSLHKTGTGTGAVISQSVSGISCGEGSGCSASYEEGTSVTLTASADAGSTFVGWNGACTGSSNTCTVFMDEAKTVTAKFDISTYDLTIAKDGLGLGIVTSSPSGISCGSGSDCSKNYLFNDVITLNAAPSTGSYFAGWSGGGCSGVGSCEVTMNSDKHITAKFIPFTQRAIISASPKAVNLGLVKIGDTTTRTVTVKNTGKSELEIFDVHIEGPDEAQFKKTADNCTTLQPGSSPCTIDITFIPTETFGKKTAIMKIFSNDPKKPITIVKLLGLAPPPKISVSPRAVNFGGQIIGGTSEPKTITIKNTGLSDLIIDSIEINDPITGEDSSEFSMTTNNCTGVTIPQGGHCTITATFSPATTSGKKIEVMRISSNDPKKPTVNVKLTGIGFGL